MLTKVYLDGPMGEAFGCEWELEVSSPRDAILLIDANSPGVINWMRNHASKYTHYQVVVEYESGKTESISEGEFLLYRKMRSIRFVPIIAGSGKWGNAILGVVVIIVGVVYGVITEDWVTAAKIIQAGGEMVILGAIQAITTKTPNKRLESASAKDPFMLKSDAFDGPVNTTHQGVPIPVMYGRNKVGSHVVSAGIYIEQLK